MATQDIKTCLRVQVANLQSVAFMALEAHWNVAGPFFGPLHALFGDVYKEVLEVQDTLAERVRALQGFVPAGFAAFTRDSEIKPTALATASSQTMVRALLDAYKTLIDCTRKAIRAFEESDCVTANMLQDICARYEKRAWMLRMHLIQEKEK